MPEQTFCQLCPGRSPRQAGFSPLYPTAKAGGFYGAFHKERLRRLADHDLIHPSIRESIQPILEEEFIFPEDILSAIKSNPKAWEHYQQFSPAYQRIRVAYMDNARKRPEAFEKRLLNFIRKTQEGKQIGYGGIDKYF